jgi:hypothetical protein
MIENPCLLGIDSSAACRLIYAVNALSTDPYNHDCFATWKIISSLGYQVNPVIDCPIPFLHHSMHWIQ